MLMILGIIIILLIIGIVVYNNLIAKKNEVDNIFAGMDVALKKRTDLIPNIVASVSKYMKHEKYILEEITKLRSEALRPDITNDDKIEIENKINSALGSIMVAVENYPDLKANENVLNLQRTLNEVESQISAARRAYNQAVTDYNNALEMFPSNIVASAMNLKLKVVFNIEENERKNVNVNKLFEE